MDEKKHNKMCRKCCTRFIWFDDETWWDYKGYTPTKLTKCPNCGLVQAVDYELEQNVNFDDRYYI